MNGKVIDAKRLYRWCSVKPEQLENHPERKVSFKLVADSATMGYAMAKELAREIAQANADDRPCRAIVPCGPKSWYAPFADMVNREKISMKNTVIFHMDECLDWQGDLLADNDPYNFKTFMLRHFYAPIDDSLAVPPENRHFLNPRTMEDIARRIAEAPIDITLGGWGQDGHIAYNQARRHPFSPIDINQLRSSTIRIQENNLDTIITLGQRSFGAAYQFVPPMSITLGVKECLGAKKVRVYSDTGTWKQTALRVALFSDIDPEYPLTLLQEHPDALITATYETACHPIADNPDWTFKGINA